MRALAALVAVATLAVLVGFTPAPTVRVVVRDMSGPNYTVVGYFHRVDDGQGPLDSTITRLGCGGLCGAFEHRQAGEIVADSFSRAKPAPGQSETLSFCVVGKRKITTWLTGTDTCVNYTYTNPETAPSAFVVDSTAKHS